MSELTDATAAITALITSYGQTRDELVEVMTTPADGGDAGNGKVKVTLPNGSTIDVPSVLSVASSHDYVDEALLMMTTRFIELQTMIVNRWNEEDAND